MLLRLCVCAYESENCIVSVYERISQSVLPTTNTHTHIILICAHMCGCICVRMCVYVRMNVCVMCEGNICMCVCVFLRFLFLESDIWHQSGNGAEHTRTQREPRSYQYWCA